MRSLHTAFDRASANYDVPLTEMLQVLSRRQERRHRGFACRLVAVCWRAILMIAKGQRPHPRHANWHSGRLHDPANDDAIAEHAVVVIVPLAGWARSRRTLEDQIV